MTTHTLPTLADIVAAYGDNKINVDRLEDMLRSAAWTYYHGPSVDGDYWINVEPLEHYRWESLGQTVSDINDTLSHLPTEFHWWDVKTPFAGEWEPEWIEFFDDDNGDRHYQWDYEQDEWGRMTADVETDGYYDEDCPRSARLRDIVDATYSYVVELLDI